jgi:hypothetical protein
MGITDMTDWRKSREDAERNKAWQRDHEEQQQRLRGKSPRDKVGFGLNEMLIGAADVEAGLYEFKGRDAKLLREHLGKIRGNFVVAIASFLHDHQ